MIRGMVKEKALGLDSFFMDFFKACMNIVREDVKDVFLEFH